MSDMTNPAADLDLLQGLVKKAQAAGADQADAVASRGVSISHARRLGKVEKLERSESQDLGLRVIIGKKQAVVSSNDWSQTALSALVDRAVAMAKAVPEDTYAGIATPDQITKGPHPNVDGCDPVEPPSEDLVERAAAAEEAAMAVKGVTNSDGAEADWSRWSVALAASNGFAGTYDGSRHGVGVSVLAGEGVDMEGDYDYSTKVYRADLDDAASVGTKAGERAVARLNPRKGKTIAVPVVFDPRLSNGLVRSVTGAINGAGIARGVGYLKDKLGEQILPKGVSIIDDPHRPRGLGSKPFDAEGLANAPINLVEDGVLKTWIMDLRSARQLGFESSGRAARGVSSPPSPSTTNVHMTPGTLTPEQLIGEIEEGFYITSMMGMGVNGVTGDYSRGASGFWIEKGELAYPVTEMTVAGNLIDMFLKLTPANDLTFKHATNAPTIRIDGMTVAGE